MQDDDDEGWDPSKRKTESVEKQHIPFGTSCIGYGDIQAALIIYQLYSNDSVQSHRQPHPAPFHPGLVSFLYLLTYLLLFLLPASYGRCYQSPKHLILNMTMVSSVEDSLLPLLESEL
jgi:hypothetical protein